MNSYYNSHLPANSQGIQHQYDERTLVYHDDDEDMAWCPLTTSLDAHLANDMTIGYAMPVQDDWQWQVTAAPPLMQTPINQSYCITDPVHGFTSGTQDYHACHGLGMPVEAPQWLASATTSQLPNELPTTSQVPWPQHATAGAEIPCNDQTEDVEVKNPLLHPWPDVFASTRGDLSDPPLPRLGCEEPQRKARRSPEDLYTPQWTRYHGVKREGWCGWCSLWFTLRDSAYWYHMHYSHGISQIDGKRLPSPAGFKTFCDSTELQVKCGKCNLWMPLPQGDRWNTAYFRHTYKCHFKSGSRQSDGSSVSSPLSKTLSSPRRLAANM